MIAKLLSAKAAAIAVTTLLGATGAAAATGSLPTPAQTKVASALGHAGVYVPNTSHEAKADAAKADDSTAPATTTDDTKTDDSTTDTTATHGPDVMGTAQFGLCNAAKHNGNDTATDPHGVAFQNLQTAAAAAGQSVTDFCAAAIAAHSADQTATTDDDTTTTTSDDSAEHSRTTPKASHSDKSDDGETTTTTMDTDGSTSGSTTTTTADDDDAGHPRSGSGPSTSNRGHSGSANDD
jgi:hypothetical protein